MIDPNEPPEPNRLTMAGNGRPRTKEAVELVAVALAGGGTIREVAASTRVSERTIRRWLKKPGFVKRVGRFRAEAVLAGLNKLSDGMSKATNTLVGLLESTDERVKLQAAKATIELGLRARDSLELEERIRQLEEHHIPTRIKPRTFNDVVE